MDTLLAIGHHLLVFGLAIMLAAQLALVRPGLSAVDLQRVGRMDAGYGATAGLILAVGLLRIWLGSKGVGYYDGNAWFWAKMTAFAAVGLLSIPPTIAFIRWRRVLRSDTGALPPPDAVRRIQHILRLEVGVFLLIPVFAALMARHQG